MQGGGPTIVQHCVTSFMSDPLAEFSPFLQIWTPQEYMAEMLSFAILNRGPLSIVIHPLAQVTIDFFFKALHPEFVKVGNNRVNKGLKRPTRFFDLKADQKLGAGGGGQKGEIHFGQ